MSFQPVLALHIPDGFLSAPVAGVGWLVLVLLVAVALRQTRDTLGERQIPLMGILAAENLRENQTHDLWAVNSDYETYQESALITETGLVSQDHA